jgi:8-oxo-dGDP phosphatase
MAHKAVIIVAIVVVENEKILMVQEAKAECYGKWYLPAGKVEINENIIDAAKREVLEETGLFIEIHGAFSIEHHCFPEFDWLRFGLNGKIVGGALKTKVHVIAFYVCV